MNTGSRRPSPNRLNRATARPPRRPNRRSPTESTAPSGTDGAPDEGGGTNVVVGAVLEPTSLDIVHTAGAALDQILLDNIYETLLTADETGAIQPGLADGPRGVRRRHGVHVLAPGRRDVPRRPAADVGRRRVVARGALGRGRRRCRGSRRDHVDHRPRRPHRRVDARATRQRPAVQPHPSRRRRAAGRRDRSRELGDRNRSVRLRRVEHGQFDLARRQRRLLG